MKHSYSSIKSYETCPFKYKLTRIEHLKEPSGPDAERGVAIHSEFENAILALPLLDSSRSWWLDYIDELKAKKAMPEYKFAITKNGSACDYASDNAVFRGIIDVLCINDKTATVSDWKTGKERDYSDQLKVYATVVFLIFPYVDKVITQIDYIDHNKHVPGVVFTRDQLPALCTDLDFRIETIVNDDIYAPNPNANCRWCHFRKDNGGPCKW